MTEVVGYYSATDLGLKPGDQIRVAPHALNGHKGSQAYHALSPEDMAQRDWLVHQVGGGLVFIAAVRTDRDGMPVIDHNGVPLTLDYTHRTFPLEATVFHPIDAIRLQP